MSGKVFLDTNILLYAHDRRNPLKQSIAAELIRNALIDSAGVISYQVMHEFFNVALTKVALKMRHEDARLYLEGVLRRFTVVPSSISLVSEAIRIQERFRLSWYDSLIVSAAQYAGCTTLYSEDLQHGQQLGVISVVNPFL
jgi:predicted nucleic acid-binding protein